MVRLLNVVLPDNVSALPLPTNVTVLAPAVKVPVLAQLPPSLIAVIVPTAKVPAVIEKLLLMLSVSNPLPPVNVPLLLLTVKLLKVCGLVVPLSACAPEPLKVTVFVPLPGVNVPEFAQLPATLMFDAVPAAKVPLVIVKAPFSVRVARLPAALKVCAVFATVMLLKV